MPKNKIFYLCTAPIKSMPTKSPSASAPTSLPHGTRRQEAEQKDLRAPFTLRVM